MIEQKCGLHLLPNYHEVCPICLKVTMVNLKHARVLGAKVKAASLLKTMKSDGRSK